MSGLDSGQDEGGYGDAGSGYDSGTSDFGGGSEPDFGAGDYLASQLAQPEYSVPSSFPSDDKFYGADPSGARKPGESNEVGLFEGIGNFLKDTVTQAFKNPGTFLMNTAVNLNPFGALANIISGLATGKSIGTNISNTVGGQNVQASPFNQALGDVGQDIRGVFSNLPDNLNIQDFFSQREPTSFSPEQARQLNAAASRIPNIGDPLVATGDPISLSPKPVSDPYTSASSIGVQQVDLPNLTPSGSRFTSAQSGNPQQYLDAVNRSTINQSRTANPASFDKNISDQKQALSQIDLMFGGQKQFADSLLKSRG
tara:strand:+ start:14 stop:949 length:936 start_codon:yes stop_codon:yes gene_type:complete